jgi:hypothetical protein
MTEAPFKRDHSPYEGMERGQYPALLRVQGGFLCHQFSDQLLGPVDRDLIRDGALYQAIPLDVLVDLCALLTHEQFRIRA